MRHTGSAAACLLILASGAAQAREVRVMSSGGLTAASTGEQASAGLDRLDADELARFTALNAAYREKFGFPFIIAVKGLGKADILAAFEQRLGQDREAERAEALRQIERVALLRLQAIKLAGAMGR